MRPPTSSNYSNSGGGGGGATTSPTTTSDMKLPPGFRFYPTDEELVVQYLCPKTAGKAFPPHIIGDIDLYKYDPWELPSKALFGESEWYFFSPRDRKYPNGSRPNRGAGSGYWKATGTDKLIKDHGRKVGIKKALVFYVGKAPKGTKTNWIMHEYRILAPSVPISSRNSNPINPNNNYPAPAAAGSSPNFTNLLQDKTKAAAAGSLRLDDWVLCRIYKKLSGAEKIAGAGGPYEVVGESSSAGSFFSDDIHDVFSSLGDINSNVTMFPTAPAPPLKVEDFEQQQHQQYYTNYNISDHHQQQLDQFIDVGTSGSLWNNNNSLMIMSRSNSLKKMDLEMMMRLQQQQKQLQAAAAADHQEQFYSTNMINMSSRISNNIVTRNCTTTDHEHDMGTTSSVVVAAGLRRDDQDEQQLMQAAGGDHTSCTEAAAAATCSSSSMMMMMMNGSAADQKEKLELGARDDHHMSLRRQVSGGGRLYRQPSFPWLVDPILLEPSQLDQLL